MRDSRGSIHSLLAVNPAETGGDSGPRTSNYASHLDGFSNENWGVIVMGAFVLFLLVMIRRAFRR